jgi:hypothetical protein
MISENCSTYHFFLNHTSANIKSRWLFRQAFRNLVSIAQYFVVLIRGHKIGKIIQKLICTLEIQRTGSFIVRGYIDSPLDKDIDIVINLDALYQEVCFAAGFRS